MVGGELASFYSSFRVAAASAGDARRVSKKQLYCGVSGVLSGSKEKSSDVYEALQAALDYRLVRIIARAAAVICHKVAEEEGKAAHGNDDVKVGGFNREAIK